MRRVLRTACFVFCIASVWILTGSDKSTKILQKQAKSEVLSKTISLAAYPVSANEKSEQRSSREGEIGSAKSLSGTLYLEKAKRLALYLNNGDFELWDTARGLRLREVERLRRPVGWCIASPDETAIVTGDRMVDPFNSDDRELWWKEFVPSIAVWDTKTGVRKHLIRLPEAVGPPDYIHKWYARWLDNSRVVIVRLLRENPARASSLRFILIDTVKGNVVKASKDEFTGESILLSPDRKLAIVMDDNRLHRTQNDLVIIRRNIYARTRIFDMERLSLVSSWREPPISPGGEEDVALLARWCPDGKKVITVGYERADARLVSKVRLWDTRSGRLVRTFSCHKDFILDVAVTVHNEKMLTASEDQSVRVWDMRTGKLESILSGHRAGLNKVIILPGDKLAVSAAEEPTAKVWDLTTGKLKFDLADHDSVVRELDVVTDKIVRTVTLLGTVTTWDCSTGKQLRRTPKPSTFPKRFGVCELTEKEGVLYMRILNQGHPFRNEEGEK